LGGILVPVYALANVVWFGSPLPVSALAKGIHTSSGVNFVYARRVALGTVYGPTVAVVLPLGLIALWLLVRHAPQERPVARCVGGIALIFAFVFFGLNALKDWVFFGWYAYPIAVATIPAMVFISERWTPLIGVYARMILMAFVVVLSPVTAVRYYVEHGPRWSTADNPLLAMSQELAKHVRGRDGLFAMGAIAGFASYVLDKPVLQLEGIISDPRLVDHVRQQTPLEEVLEEYGVDYLIVSLKSVRPEERNGCYLVTQPHAEWAGRRTAKLTGEICVEPFVRFMTEKGTRPWSRFSSLETLVWDLRDARWRRPGSEDAWFWR
jgi:hypothetical protein